MGGVRRILGREKTEREKILKMRNLLSKQSCIYAFVVNIKIITQYGSTVYIGIAMVYSH